MSQEQSKEVKEPKWVSDFKADTAKWYKDLLDTGQCLICGIHPDLILKVSKLIPIELKLTYEAGKESVQPFAGQFANVAKLRLEHDKQLRTATLKECIEIGNGMKKTELIEPTLVCQKCGGHIKSLFHLEKCRNGGYDLALSDYQQQLEKLL